MELAGRILGVVATTTFLTAVSPEFVLADDVERGKVLAERLCLKCHASLLDVAGPNPNAPALASFKKKWPLSHLEEALAEGIVTGHDNQMPVFEFSPTEISDLLKYIDSLSR
jgi:cytochrome c